MKKIVLIFIALATMIGLPSEAQTKKRNSGADLDLRLKDRSKVYQAVERPGSFPGGDAAMLKWIKENLIYPESARINGITGRVFVSFIIEKDGSISDVTILKGVDPDLDKEAVRLVTKMPRWTPGKNDGVPVRSYFRLPITFKYN